LCCAGYFTVGPYQGVSAGFLLGRLFRWGVGEMEMSGSRTLC